MLKLLIMSLLMLIFVAPAAAKPRDVYPVPCDDLWAAVKHTLENPRDYAVISMNNEGQNTSFTVIGNLTVYVDKVALTPREGGCAVTAKFLQVGSDDSDWRQFRHRFERSLTKQLAAKPKPAATSDGQL